uniref:Tyrosine-protein phosphatase domain-containing protein n=1 Tax=Strongyloides papillosus TaxID=174720 RepID=A0A0N5C7S2_STREA
MESLFSYLTPRRKKNNRTVTEAEEGDVTNTMGNEKNHYNNEHHDGNRTTSVHFNKNLTAFVRTACEIGVTNLVKEFQELQSYEQKHIKSHKAFGKNINKCRYKDILCYDDTRFILKKSRNDNLDFIHANYVGSSRKNSYICTQAPLPDTVKDFWRMVWQSRARSVVMLCEIMENGKVKSEQYWPIDKSEILRTGNMLIKFLNKYDFEKNIVRSNLLLKKGRRVRLVAHYQYFKWPDRGVPSNYLVCLRLMKKVTKKFPVIVHCSAGIGRTGTVVCLDDMITKLSKPGGCLRMKNALLEYRQYRYGIVQTEVQYLFIHRVLMTLAIQKNLISMNEIAQFIKLYDIVMSKLCENPAQKAEQLMQTQEEHTILEKMEQVSEVTLEEVSAVPFDDDMKKKNNKGSRNNSFSDSERNNGEN